MKQAIADLIIAIIELLRKNKTEAAPFLPTTRKRIHWIVLQNTLRRDFPDAQVYMSKEWYSLANFEDMQEFLRLDNTDKHHYNLDSYRCSDFAFRLKGQLSVPGWSDLTHGLFWTTTHAMISIIDQNMDKWYIEPQTDSIEKRLQDWQGKKCRLIVM